MKVFLFLAILCLAATTVESRSLFDWWSDEPEVLQPQQGCILTLDMTLTTAPCTFSSPDHRQSVWNGFLNEHIVLQILNRRNHTFLEHIVSLSSVTRSCIRQAQRGLCTFYDCLESRFPCGTDGYAMRHGKYFCQRFDSVIVSIDSVGRQWVNDTNICIESALLTVYQAESTTCDAIMDQGANASVSCQSRLMNRQDFCSVVRGNWQTFWGIMDMSNLYRTVQLAPSSMLGMLGQIVNCGTESLKSGIGGILRYLPTLRYFFS